jgi:hypothetical protein
VNAERLHAIAEVLRAEIRETNYPALLDALVEGLRDSVKAPSQAAPQEQASAARQELNAVLREAPSNSFSPAWRQALEEMEVVDLLGEPLADELERILSTNEITPGVAANEIFEIQKRVKEFVASLDQAASALSFFQIGQEDLSPGEFEIGFLIPRRAVDNGLEQLGEEFIELKQILAPFNELAGEGRPELQVRTISSSEFQVFLDSVPAVAALVATSVERLLAAYERILSIRNLHKQLSEQDVPDEVLEGVATHVSKGMESEIREIVEATLAKARLEDVDRLNELRTELRIRLGEIAQRIDRGYNIEVRVGKSSESTGEDDEEKALDSKTYEAVNAVLKAQPGLEFMNVSGKPILKLDQGNEDDPDEKP